MSRIEIEESLSDIFIKRVSIDFMQKSEMKDKKLLGKIAVPARELLYIYFDVEDVFNISIPEEDITNGRFDTFSNIADIIEEQLQT